MSSPLPSMSTPALAPTPPDSTPPTPRSYFPSYSYSYSSSGPATTTTTGSSSDDSPKSLTHSLLSIPDTLLHSFSSLSFPPAIAAARMAIVSMMSHSITWGQIRILTTDHGIYTFPSADRRQALGLGDVQVPKDQIADIRIIRDTFWFRLVVLADLGFAEAYMAGDCEVSDLVQVFKIFIRSRPSLQSDPIPGVSTLPSKLFSVITYITNSRFANTLTNSLSNIRAHYDLSNGMFAAFLSRDMTYSCGIFADLDGDLKEGDGEFSAINGAIGLKRIANGEKEKERAEKDLRVGGEVDELEESQLRKIRHIIKKADIRAGHRVLEIGSGWGSFAIEAVRSTGCTVDTITLSSQQKALAEERIKAAGLAGRIRVWLMDYRALPESWKGAFDRVVSIEMLEAVGKEFIPGYFGVIDSALNETGAACIQVITIPESRFETYQKEVDFIRKWIFPGGFLPTISYVVDSIRVGAKNTLVVDSISNIGPHYARTLREWRRRFLANYDTHIKPSLRAEHPEMTDADCEVFKRKWIYYFCYCEVGFSERVLGDHIVTMIREGASDYGCATYE